MDAMTCKLEVPNIEGLKDQELTVGRHQFLNCQGEWDKSFDFAKSTFKIDEKIKYSVKVLKAEARSTNSFDVDFTLYGAGQFKFPDFILTDGTHEISLGAQQFQVVSVIEKTPDGKPPQPFAPILPLKLAWPPIYLISLLLILVSAIIYTVLKIRRRARFKKLIESLKQYDSTLSADLQFYKTMRGLEKKQYPLDELENAFKVYSLRVFQVPFFDLNSSQVQRFMKKRRPKLKKQRNSVKKFLDEFEVLSKRQTEVNATERQELAKKLYRFIGIEEDVRQKAGLQ